MSGINALLGSIRSTRALVRLQARDPLPGELLAAGKRAVKLAKEDVTRIQKKLR